MIVNILLSNEPQKLVEKAVAKREDKFVKKRDNLESIVRVPQIVLRVKRVIE